ncbi:CDGSH iron-sulfur domain-containing protein [Paraburkholderia sp. SIMBA_049]
MKNRIEIVDDGPMKLTGEFELRDDKGEVVRARKVYTLCRCGLSARLPFCDASHEAAGFSSCPRAPQGTASADAPTQPA